MNTAQMAPLEAAQVGLVVEPPLSRLNHLRPTIIVAIKKLIMHRLKVNVVQQTEQNQKILVCATTHYAHTEQLSLLLH